MKSVAIIGGSGYTGGELLRILMNHPEFEVEAVTSERFASKFVHSVHPNLRGATDLKFIGRDGLNGEYDLIFTAVPHGSAMKNMPEYVKLADKVVDLSADFRLKTSDDYVKWYGHEHSCPDLLSKFVYGIAELHRGEMKKAKYVSGAGCLATSAILSLYPLVKNGLIETENIVVDSKIGSSAGGNAPSLDSHHPERSGAVRSYKPTGHRHTAEMIQELTFAGKAPNISFTPHAIEMVRGILSTCHVRLKDADIEDKDIWKAYRGVYDEEPFIRIVKDKQGVYRFPEPKILTGSNFCDIGFEK
ncbi:MAG: N-acetyl-gamma-glutamyl-phosphate reductase, partial [Candidatus Altiarchaeota archaeon]